MWSRAFLASGLLDVEPGLVCGAGTCRCGAGTSVPAIDRASRRRRFLSRDRLGARDEIPLELSHRPVRKLHLNLVAVNRLHFSAAVHRHHEQIALSQLGCSRLLALTEVNAFGREIRL